MATINMQVSMDLKTPRRALGKLAKGNPRGDRARISCFLSIYCAAPGTFIELPSFIKPTLLYLKMVFSTPYLGLIFS